MLLVLELGRIARKQLPNWYAGDRINRILLAFTQGLVLITPRACVAALAIRFYHLNQTQQPVPVWEIKLLRYMLASGFLFQSFAVFFYMQMMTEEFSRLYDLLQYLVASIVNVLIMSIILIFAFTLPFFIVGENQIQFEIRNEKEILDNDIALYKHAIKNA